MYKEAKKARLIGFFASLVLTLAAYIAIVNPQFLRLTSETAIHVICILAFLQATVQCLFFLDVWHEHGAPWNLNVFASTLSIIFIIVFFSIWIMDNLNYNMMPGM